MDFEVTIVRLWLTYRPHWPNWIYICILALVGVGYLGVKKLNWDENVVRSRFLFFLYMAYVVSMTVLSREKFAGVHFEPRLFWSYAEVLKGRMEYLEGNFLNILLLSPFGFLFPKVWNTEQGRSMVGITIICGMLFLLFVEGLQYVTERGLFETDDIFHGFLGIVLGYVVFFIRNRSKKVVKND